MINRERKVDLTKLSREEFNRLELQLGERVRQICDEACEKANKLLNIYGLKTKMQIVIDAGEATEAPAVAPKKVRGRPRKVAANL